MLQWETVLIENLLKSNYSPGMAACTSNTTTQVAEDDCHELKANMGHIVNSRQPELHNETIYI